MFCSENKGGNDVEGKIFADMLSGVWNDARPLEHNVGTLAKLCNVSFYVHCHSMCNYDLLR